MIRKNKISTGYIASPLNNSPSKEAHKFGSSERFITPKKFSPDKIYDIPALLDKRSTSFGYGNKVDIVLKDLNDPAKYNLRGEFDQIAKGYRFGIRPQSKQTVSKDYSFNNLRQTVDLSFNKQLDERKTFSKSKKISPAKKQTQNVNERHRIKSLFDHNDNKSNIRKSAKRLKYEYSQNYLLRNNRPSYTDFIKPERERPKENPHKYIFHDERLQRENIEKPDLHSTFGKQQRLKQKQLLPPRLGPGSQQISHYKSNVFSDFGDNMLYF